MSLASIAGGGSYCEWLARHAGSSSLKRLRFTSPSSYADSKRRLYRRRDLVAGNAWPTQQHMRRCFTSSLLPSSIGRNRTPSRSFSHSRTSLTQETPPQSPSSSSSVSANEVSHFSALASSWWDPHGPSRLLHLMNPLRHDFIQSSLALSSTPPPPQLTYLDIGCGGGIFSCSAALLPRTQSVTGIDPTGACIDAALAHARTDPALRPPPQGGKLRFVHTAIEDLASYYPDGLFPPVDIVTVFEVVEHVTSPASFLRSAATHLKPGGWLIGSTISRHPLSYITTKLLGEAPVFGFVPSGTHDWKKYINPDELRKFFETDVDERERGRWQNFHVQGVVYVPGLGWREVTGSERVGNYFFGVQKVDGK